MHGGQTENITIMDNGGLLNMTWAFTQNDNETTFNLTSIQVNFKNLTGKVTIQLL